MAIVSDTFGVTFAPERWGFCEKFHHFMGPPFAENGVSDQANRR
jgi:hypothetical protein